VHEFGSRCPPVSVSLRHISSGSHQKASVSESPERKAVARLSGVGTPVRTASRLAQSSRAYSSGIPTGHTMSIAYAVLRVASYSSVSHDIVKEARKYRRTLFSLYSNGSHKKALKMRAEVLGTTRNVNPTAPTAVRGAARQL
jgi:hypothetical protein